MNERDKRFAIKKNKSVSVLIVNQKSQKDRVKNTRWHVAAARLTRQPSAQTPPSGGA